MIGFAKAFPLFVHGMFQVVFLVAKDFREIFRWAWLVDWIPILMECLTSMFGF